jgi:hypothetical protein
MGLDGASFAAEILRDALCDALSIARDDPASERWYSGELLASGVLCPAEVRGQLERSAVVGVPSLRTFRDRSYSVPPTTYFLARLDYESGVRVACVRVICGALAFFFDADGVRTAFRADDGTKIYGRTVVAEFPPPVDLSVVLPSTFQRGVTPRKRRTCAAPRRQFWLPDAILDLIAMFAEHHVLPLCWTSVSMHDWFWTSEAALRRMLLPAKLPPLDAALLLHHAVPFREPQVLEELRCRMGPVEASKSPEFLVMMAMRGGQRIMEMLQGVPNRGGGGGGGGVPPRTSILRTPAGLADASVLHLSDGSSTFHWGMAEKTVSAWCDSAPPFRSYRGEGHHLFVRSFPLGEGAAEIPGLSYHYCVRWHVHSAHHACIGLGDSPSPAAQFTPLVTTSSERTYAAM